MKKSSRPITITYIVLVVLTLCYAIFGELLLPNEKAIYSQESICEEDNEGWYYETASGNRKEIEIPTAIDTPKGEELIIKKTLPNDIDDSAYMIFRSAKQDVAIYIEDEKRAEYTTKDTRFFGELSTPYYIFVKLHPADAGKEIKVSYVSDSRYSGVVSEILYANFFGFLNYEVKSQGMVFVVSLIIITISTLTMLLSIILHIAYKKEQKLTSISGGVLVVALWILFNSVFRQFIFRNVSVVGDLTFMMVALLPFPFAYYINLIQNNRFRPVFLTIECACIVSFISSTVLYIAGIVDYSGTFYGMGVVLLCLVIAVIVTVIIDAFTGHIKEYLAIAIAFSLAGIVMIAQVIVYLTTDGTLDITMAAIGLLVILLMAVASTIQDAYAVNEEKRIAVAENIAKTQFLANMSHEIRTPINSVLGMDTMILRECEDENIRKYALDIQSAGKNLLAIINDILDFSKIESGKMDLVVAEYDCASMLNDIANIIAPRAKEKGLSFNMDIDENIPVKLIGDEIRVRQILINLLTNAVKYTHSGEVTLRLSGSEAKDGMVELIYSVKDTGIGIKREDIDKLSEKFVRIEESRNRDIEGTGLGINIVVSLLNLMGSRLNVDSVYGEGSDFSFVLLQGIADREAIGDYTARKKKYSDKEDEYEVACYIPDARLLVVDDNSMNRRVFVNLLKEMGCEIHEASSGKECLKLVTEYEYDIIFMDHMMPEMDGVETYRRMKSLGEYLNTNTPVVVLTANAVAGAREAYLSEGFREYLTKPIDSDKLEQLIGRLIPFYKKKEKLPKKKAPVKETITLPVIDGIDWEGANRMFNNINLLTEAVKSFSDMSSTDINTLKELYEAIERNGDYASYRIRVHSMKTSAATIGAYHLAGLAKYLEYAARDEDRDTIDRLMPVFNKEWNDLTDIINKEFGFANKKTVVSEENSLSKDELLEDLRVLKEAMQDLDIDTADALIEKFQNNSFTENQTAILEKLALAVTNMDIPMCDELTDEWMNIL